MDISAHDDNFFPIRVIDSYRALIWTERYFEFGEFELYLPNVESSLDLLSGVEYLRLEGRKTSMVVETIETTDQEIKVSGRSLESILDRRVIQHFTPTTNFIGLLGSLVNENMSQSAVLASRRTELYWALVTPTGFTNPSDFGDIGIGENLYDVVSRLCAYYDLGFYVRTDPSDEKDIFLPTPISGRVYWGQDRSVKNPVIFSEDMGNIYDATTLESSVPDKNAAAANLPPETGNGLGDLYWTYRGSTPLGLSRREVWVDVSSLRRDSSLTTSNKARRARTLGRKVLAENTFVDDIDFSMANNGVYEYGEDYGLGDTVMVVSPKGEMIKHRVLEHITSVNAEGIKAYPTLKKI